MTVKRITKRITLSLLLATLVLLSAALLLCTRGPSRQPNILWITIDSLRYDHLGCLGYNRPTSPNIDALAQESALFVQCIAQSNYTNISVPSMVTGIYPTLLDVRTPVHNLDDLFVTLAERLSRSGYATNAVLPDWPTGINQGFERVEVLDSDTDKRTEACLDIIQTLDERPFFIWLYYWDPHAPYQPPEEFADLFQIEQPVPPIPAGVEVTPQDLERWRETVRRREGWEMMKTLLKINEGNLSPGADVRERFMTLYDAEIAYVDDRLKKVFDALKELGLWDQTMVILNADHGEGFGEHDLFFHGYGLYEEEVRVPLIIKPPRSLSSSRKIESAVRNLDIMPTILDYCGQDVPKKLNGYSLRPGIENGSMPDRPAAMESNTPERGVHLVGYRRGGFKVIYRKGKPPALFHLLEDPGERLNLLTAEGSIAGDEWIAGADQDPVIESAIDTTMLQTEQQMRRELLAIYGVKEVADLLYTHHRKRIDPRNREKLRALGYIY
jgi:arylsulfatase A-like enzyme